MAVIESCTTSRHRVARWLVAIKLRRAVSRRKLCKAWVRHHDGNHEYEEKTEDSDK
jgi:hypothetical protein